MHVTMTMTSHLWQKQLRARQVFKLSIFGRNNKTTVTVFRSSVNKHDSMTAYSHGIQKKWERACNGPCVARFLGVKYTRLRTHADSVFLGINRWRHFEIRVTSANYVRTRDVHAPSTLGFAQKRVRPDTAKST